MCYAEIASMVPVSGSTYAFAYAAFGELAAWLIGWTLTLEYFFAVVAVSVSWSGYVTSFLASLGFKMATSISQTPFAGGLGAPIRQVPGAIVNLPAAALVLITTASLLAGAKRTAILNAMFVVVKVAIILVFAGFGFVFVQPQNWHPFVPTNHGEFGHYGWSGVLEGAAVVCVAFIGFDAVAVLAGEARTPQRELPISIIGSVVISIVLYVLVALTITGLVPYSSLNVPEPWLAAIAAARLPWLAIPIQIGFIVALFTVALVIALALSRVMLAISRDGLLPSALGRWHPSLGAPPALCAVIGVIGSVAAALLPLDLLGDFTILASLVSFVCVCVGVLVLRYRHPNARRPFRTPFGPAVPIIGILFCLSTMRAFSFDTWVRLAIAIAVGLLVYFVYGVRHSRLMRSPFSAD
jgi:APA family basic amino acid/polyamine antiporter